MRGFIVQPCGVGSRRVTIALAKLIDIIAIEKRMLQKPPIGRRKLWSQSSSISPDLQQSGSGDHRHPKF
jgi:hypothetical protein